MQRRLASKRTKIQYSFFQSVKTVLFAGLMEMAVDILAPWVTRGNAKYMSFHFHDKVDYLYLSGLSGSPPAPPHSMEGFDCFISVILNEAFITGDDVGLLTQDNL